MRAQLNALLHKRFKNMSSISIKDLRKRFPQIAFMDKQGDIYLDSASSTLKMDLVLDVLKDFYETGVSNVHRGEHHLSLKATKRYEQARSTVAHFLGSEDPSEIIFTRNTTESLNFLSETLGEHLNTGDEIIVSEMEHHSNFLPWQNLAQKRNVKLTVIPVNKEGLLDMEILEKSFSSKTKILALTHISNVTGVINPLEKIIPLARQFDTIVVIDAAQSVSCLPINVKKMNCDFLVFSGHKIFSPTGIGVLYGKRSRLKQLSPYQRGGGTIFKVSLDHTDWAEIPYKFEAGTPFIEGALALASVLSFFKKEVDFEHILKWEKELVLQAEDSLSQIPNLHIIGSKNNRSNILSFIVKGIHSADLSFILTKQKLALRSGHHCCMPLMERLELSSGTIRASFSVYNRKEDVEALKKGLIKALKILKP